MSNAVRKGYVADDFNNVLKYAIATGAVEPGSQQIDHYQVPGLYVRRCRLKKKSVGATYVHKFDHVAFCLQGTVIIVDQDGTKTVVEAPDIIITKAGTQRAIYAATDVDWATAHPTDHTDLATIEEALGCRSMKEYYALLGYEVEDGTD